MTQKIYTYGVEDGRSAIDEAVSGKVSSDYFIKLRDEHPEMYNVLITLPKSGVFKGYTHAKFGLRKEDKTLGTYSTRVNKLVEDIDPEYRDSHTSSASTSTRKSDVRIILLNEVAVRVEAGDAWATRNLSGHVETNDFGKLAYWIEALEYPYKWENRIERMTQCVLDENGDVVECTSPEWVLSYKGVTATFENMKGNKPSDEFVASARGRIAQTLITKGDFDVSGLADCEPEMVGGGEVWLGEWIAENYTKPEDKPLPKSADNAEK